MDVLTVCVPCSDGEHYHVWSDKDERMYLMTAKDIAYHENETDDEVVWECVSCQ